MKIISKDDIDTLITQSESIKIYAPNVYKKSLFGYWHEYADYDLLKRENIIFTTSYYSSDETSLTSNKNQFFQCIQNSVPIVFYVRKIRDSTNNSKTRINKFITLQWIDDDNFQFIEGIIPFNEFEQNKIAIKKVMDSI